MDKGLWTCLTSSKVSIVNFFTLNNVSCTPKLETTISPVSGGAHCRDRSGVNGGGVGPQAVAGAMLARGPVSLKGGVCSRLRPLVAMANVGTRSHTFPFLMTLQDAHFHVKFLGIFKCCQVKRKENKTKHRRVSQRK